MTSDDAGNHFTECGLPGIQLVPYGIHACHFYTSREELVGTLVPYFKAGLENNERCLWICAPPLPAREAVHALRQVWSGADDALQSGALRILDFEQWYANSAGLQGTDLVKIWLKEEERALAEGYRGLRITGNISFLKATEWSTFMEYENCVSAQFRDRRIVSLCSYPSAACSEKQAGEVIHAHDCTFERPDSDWRVVASA